MVHKGFHEEHLFTIHNSLDHKSQVDLRNSLKESDIYTKYFNNNYPVLIFIGRLTPVKKLNQLIDELGVLNAKGEQYNLVLVGDGSEKNNLQQLVNRTKLNDKVWFYGACYDEYQNAELIYNADLCVAPGNVGLTAMHTMVFGTPVLTHNDFKWQMPEFEAIVPNKTGYFIKSGDTTDLADKIEQWFNDKVNSREIVRNACYNEIDTSWTPQFQLEVLKKGMNIW